MKKWSLYYITLNVHITNICTIQYLICSAILSASFFQVSAYTTARTENIVRKNKLYKILIVPASYRTIAISYAIHVTAITICMKGNISNN